jgi:hypothetical protein
VTDHQTEASVQLARIDETTDYIRTRSDQQPLLGIVLGTA